MIEFAVKTAVFGNHVSSIVQPAAILKCLRTTMRTGLCTITRCGRVPAACARQTVIKSYLRFYDGRSRGQNGGYRRGLKAARTSAPALSVAHQTYEAIWIWRLCRL